MTHEQIITELIALRAEVDALKARQHKERTMLFRNSKWAKATHQQLHEALGPLGDGVNLAYYRDAVATYSDKENKYRTDLGWLATIRTFLRRDADSGRLRRMHEVMYTSR